MKIIAIYSSKGGVGKTAAAVNLSYSAALDNKRVLLCDMDAQGASTYYFRVRPKKKYNSKKLLAGNLENYIRASDYDRLDLLPAHFSYRNLDIALAKLPKNKRKGLLTKLFNSLAEEYDVMVLDCPPNLTLFSENIIKVADRVITPLIPTTLSLVAFAQLLKLFKKTGTDVQRIRGFFSMVDRRKSMHLDIVNEYSKSVIFSQVMIPYLAEVEKMGVYRQPVAATSAASPAAKLYAKLWQEISQGIDAS